MKNQKLPTASKFSIVRQLCNYIPNHLVPKLARETGVDEQARTYEEWSHIVTLCYAQVTHSIGLNDVCDALQLNSGPLSAIRGATPPTRNNRSEEHTSELQSLRHLVCRLLLEKKKKNNKLTPTAIQTALASHYTRLVAAS